MTAKEYLSQAYRLDQKINSHIEEVSRLRSMAQSISSPGWGEKVQSSRNTDAPYVRCLEKIIALEGIYSEKISEQSELIRRIIDEIEKFTSNIRLVNSPHRGE